MKPNLTNLLKSAAGLIFITTAACTSTKNVGNDDLYYSSKDEPKQESSSNTSSQAGSAPEQNLPERFSDNGNSGGSSEPASSERSTTTTETKDGDTYITNNNYYEGYSADDYYDYAYSARIRRFYGSPSWDYYDSYYTNAYWYDPSPYYTNVSIYSTYRWWGPSYHSGYYYNTYRPYGWSVTIGTGWDPWYSPYSAWHPYHNPYWYWGNPYGYNNYSHGYYHGYNNGYNNGFYDGYYSGIYNRPVTPYYYNSLDNTTRYYGPRQSVNSNGAVTASLGEKYERAVSLENGAVRTDTKGGKATDVKTFEGTRSSTAKDNTLTGKDTKTEGAVKTGPGSGRDAVKSDPSGRDAVIVKDGPASGSTKDTRTGTKEDVPAGGVSKDSRTNTPAQKGSTDIETRDGAGSKTPAATGTGRPAESQPTEKVNPKDYKINNTYPSGRDAQPENRTSPAPSTTPNRDQPRQKEPRSYQGSDSRTYDRGNSNQNYDRGNSNQRQERGNSGGNDRMQTHPRSNTYNPSQPSQSRPSAAPRESAPRNNSYSSPSAQPQHNTRPARPRN